MMSSLLNQRSTPFRLIQLATVFLWLWNGLHRIENTVTTNIAYALIFIIIGFALFPWYSRKYKGLGIEDHFEKMLIPTTYLVLLDQILRLFFPAVLIWNIFLVSVFSFFITVNLILLFFHFRDHDKTPPAYFAAGLFLGNDGNSGGKSN